MAEKDPRLTQQSLRVLHILLENPRDTLAGSDIVRQTGMLSGTLYPILMRLERAGWVESRWEHLDPSEVGRPRKRFYSLTGVGHNKASEALKELALVDGRLAWSS